MGIPLLFAWCERVRLRGKKVPDFITKVMAADGTMLAQRPFESAEWGRADAEKPGRFADEFPLGYGVRWLGESPEDDLHWWQAMFVQERHYVLRRVLGAPAYVEFRDAKTSAVLGHVIRHPLLPNQFYVTKGESSPRPGDLFPEPAYATFGDAMRAAHAVFVSRSAT